MTMKKKEFLVCRLVASQSDKKEIFPLDSCEHNKYNVEQYIDRVLYKVGLEMKN